MRNTTKTRRSRQWALLATAALLASMLATVSPAAAVPGGLLDSPGSPVTTGDGTTSDDKDGHDEDGDDDTPGDDLSLTPTPPLSIASRTQYPQGTPHLCTPTDP